MIEGLQSRYAIDVFANIEPMPDLGLHQGIAASTLCLNTIKPLGRTLNFRIFR